MDEKKKLQSFVIEYCPRNGVRARKHIASAFHEVIGKFDLKDKTHGITVDFYIFQHYVYASCGVFVSHQMRLLVADRRIFRIYI